MAKAVKKTTLTGTDKPDLAKELKVRVTALEKRANAQDKLIERLSESLTKMKEAMKAKPKAVAPKAPRTPKTDKTDKTEAPKKVKKVKKVKKAKKPNFVE